MALSCSASMVAQSAWRKGRDYIVPAGGFRSRMNRRGCQLWATGAV